MELIAIVLSLTAAASCFVSDTEWSDYKAKHNKVYESLEEERFRKNVYEENKKWVEEHNKKFEDGLVTFDMAINHLSDMTHDEYRQYANCLSKNVTNSPTPRAQYVVLDNVTVPDTVDWRTKGAITPVKAQGHCGGCWAFSTTGAVEAHYFIKTQTTVLLSEQNLIDCVQKCRGCRGGWMDLAFQYIIDNRGIDTEESYPYEERDNLCRYNPAYSGASVFSYEDIPRANEEALKQVVALKGPVSVVIDARDPQFKHYHHGVYNNPSCSTFEFNHAILIIGYGTDPQGGDYWLVKNSWSTQWGLAGFGKMSRNKRNQCGIANAASFPIIK